MLRELSIHEVYLSTIVTNSFDLRWKLKSQDTRRKISKNSVGDPAGYDPCWFREGLRQEVMQENGEFAMEKEMTIESGGLGRERQEEEDTIPMKVSHDSALQQKEAALILQDNVFQDDACTLIALLNACAKEKDFHKGSRIHIHLVKSGLHAFVGSALINMYAKCGALSKAQQVFDGLPERNVVTWNTLIAGYAQHGHGEDALHCFETMQLAGFSPNVITFICALKACGSVGDLDKGQDIHTQILRQHLLDQHIEVANALVDMYAKCGKLDKAQEVFDALPVRNIVSWTALITGYAQHGHGNEALSSFERMQMWGLSPDAVTLSCVLKACGSIGAFDKGQEIHAQILRECLLREDIVIANALIDMYGKCGALENAQKVFDELPVRNIISWNTLIAGYAQHGHGKEAIECFDQMQFGGLFPDAATLVCVLKACASVKALDRGQEIHSQIVRECLFVADTRVANAFIDMYAKCGALDEAQEVFDELSARDVISWNALITGYDQHNFGEKALDCFEQMQLDGFSPDVVTSSCSLKACGGIGAACNGQQIHAMVVKHGLLEKGMIVGISLVVMYANCGMLAEAHELFDKLPIRDVVAWSALLEGYAQLGKHETVLDLFDKMIEEGLELNWVTFVIVLNACTHGGLLEEGQIFFEIISRSFGITPTLEHYACMVDLFCRAGNLDKAVMLIKEMSLTADLMLWHTLLGACQKWGNTKLGRWAFQSAVHVDERDAAAYVCMSNMYSAAGGQEHFTEIEALRLKKQGR